MSWKKTKKDWLDQPRAHHYTFAHVALRAFCKSDPLQCFALVESEEKDNLVDFLWSRVCEQCDKSEATDINPNDIKITSLRLGEFPTILVEMPEAKAVTEAIFIAIVLTSSLGSNEADREVTYRYMVLEQGMKMDGSERTVLCEWRDGFHLNMGDGPRHNVESFLEIVSSKIKPQPAKNWWVCSQD